MRGRLTSTDLPKSARADGFVERPMGRVGRNIVAIGLGVSHATPEGIADTGERETCSNGG